MSGGTDCRSCREMGFQERCGVSGGTDCSSGVPGICCGLVLQQCSALREVSQAQEGCPDRWKPNRWLRVPKDTCWLWKAELLRVRVTVAMWSVWCMSTQGQSRYSWLDCCPLVPMASGPQLLVRGLRGRDGEFCQLWGLDSFPPAK